MKIVLGRADEAPLLLDQGGNVALIPGGSTPTDAERQLLRCFEEGYTLSVPPEMYAKIVATLVSELRSTGALPIYIEPQPLPAE